MTAPKPKPDETVVGLPPVVPADPKADETAPPVDLVDVNVQNTSPQDDAIAELRALVETLTKQVADQGAAQAAGNQNGPTPYAAMAPQVGFDKGVADHPYVVMTKGTETIDVQARHLHVLEALGWELRGSSVERG